MATRFSPAVSPRRLAVPISGFIVSVLGPTITAADPVPAPVPPPPLRPSARPVGFPPPPGVLPVGGSLPAGLQPAAEGQAPAPQPDAKAPAELLPAPKPAPAQPQPGEPPDGEFRLPGLGGPLGVTPKPTPEVRARFDKYVEKIVDPENTLDVVVNRNRLLRLKEPPTRVQVTDENVAAMTVVSPRELSLAGRRPGNTVLTLWFGDARDPGKQEVLSYLVKVFADPEGGERLERRYSALAAEINRAFPDSVVKLDLVGDNLVVGGQAKDVYEAAQIIRLILPQAPRPRGAAAQGNVVNLNDNVAPAAPDAPINSSSPLTDQGLLNTILRAPGGSVINMLRVGGEHQVMLKVTVAEVNRAAARSIGINFDVARRDGLVVFTNTTGGILTGGGAGGTGGGLAGGGITGGITGTTNQLSNLSAVFSGGQVAAAVNALRTLNLARSLAEPNLTTMNGRPASFHAGGQFPVPVVTGFTTAGLQGVTFVPFGVSLNFTPVVTDEDRVRMTVNAEVSTRDLSTGTTSIGGAAVPSLNNRSFQTTVELRAGETLAVAGLVQNNFGSSGTRVPFLGDLPVAGRLFAFDQTSHAEQELIVLVTPYLVHPLGKGDCKPPLPGSDLLPPTDCEFYLLGRLQHYPPAAAGGRGDPGLTRRRQKCEQQLLVGPVGYTDGK